MSRFRSLIGPALAVGLTGYGWLRWSTHWSLGLFAASAILLLLAIGAPRAFAPIQRVFESFGRLVATSFTWLVLSFLFVGIFLPGRILLLVLRRDPLRLRPDPRRTTYWEPLPPPAGPTHFRRQY